MGDWPDKLAHIPTAGDRLHAGVVTVGVVEVSHRSSVSSEIENSSFHPHEVRAIRLSPILE